MKFSEELHQQRWDDHRYYHHNRINQFLHLLSAMSFLTSYVLVFVNPVAAIMVGWMIAMVLRQTGHFYFEPKTYDEVNDASHEYKESVKVGYNLKRKVVLLSIWIIAPFVLYLNPSLFGLMNPPTDRSGFLYNLSILWFFTGAGALVFRTVQLFYIMGFQSGMVWFTKILTDPFHDIKIYYKSPYYIMKGDMYDGMRDWYNPAAVSN